MMGGGDVERIDELKKYIFASRLRPHILGLCRVPEKMESAASKTNVEGNQITSNRDPGYSRQEDTNHSVGCRS